MKNIAFNSISALLLLTLLIGCKKDEKKTPAKLSSLFKALEKPYETDDSASGGSYTAQSGNTRVYYANFNSQNGQPLNNGLTTNFREVIKKGDMIRYQTATQTIDGKALVSFGQLYVSVTESGKPVQIPAGQNISIDMKAQNGFAPGLDVFFGETNTATGLVTWKDDGSPDSSNVAVNFNGVDHQLQFFSPKMYWLNVATGLDVTSGPTTTVCATLPDGFTSDNTAVFLVLENNISVLSLGSSLCSPQILEGTDGTLVALAVQGNEGSEKYFLAHKTIDATPNLQVDLSPTEASIAEIEAFLNGL